MSLHFLTIENVSDKCSNTQLPAKNQQACVPYAFLGTFNEKKSTVNLR